MNVQEYKNRLLSILNRVSPILIEYNKENELSQLKGVLSSFLNEEQLHVAKNDLLTLLKDTLTDVQVKFVESEEPTNEEVELFRKYLMELKDYRQELSTPYSEIRKKVSTIIRTSKSSLSADLSNQAIAFPNEYLDAILLREEAKIDKSGDWVVAQVNEGLKAMTDDISVRIGACTDAVNEVLNCRIRTITDTISSRVSVAGSTTTTSDKVYGFGRQALPAIGLGGITATFASAILNPFLAIGAGLAVGASFLYKGITTAEFQQRRMELKQRLAPKISLAINEMKNYVIEQFSYIEEQVNDYVNEMNMAIAQEMQDCMDAIKSCENDKKDFYRKQEIMNGQMTCLETYLKQVELLMNNPFEKK